MKSFIESDLLLKQLGFISLESENYFRAHDILERILELIFFFLEKIRYKPEPIENYRSRIHDVSHAIYASKCKYFISSDKRFIAKCKAAYDFLNIKTQVFLYSEFSSHILNGNNLSIEHNTIQS
ncbi:hypothetical protein JFQ93_000260 [Aeromonas sobria]|nr:hypothetical protein [Aeromonas sobria]